MGSISAYEALDRATQDASTIVSRLADLCWEVQFRADLYDVEDELAQSYRGCRHHGIICAWECYFHVHKQMDRNFQGGEEFPAILAMQAFIDRVCVNQDVVTVGLLSTGNAHSLALELGWQVTNRFPLLSQSKGCLDGPPLDNLEFRWSRCLEALDDFGINLTNVNWLNARIKKEALRVKHAIDKGEFTTIDCVRWDSAITIVADVDQGQVKHIEDVPVANRSTFSIQRAGSQPLKIGNRREFQLIEALLSKPNRFIPHTELAEMLGLNEFANLAPIKSRLISILNSGGYSDLASCIHTDTGHYGVFFDN